MASPKVSGARIDLPREEYDALCYLRDVTHEDLRARVEQLQRQVEQQEMLEKQSRHVINEQSITIEHLRTKNLQQHGLILKMQQRLAELEPVRTNIPQPAFKRNG